MEFKEMPIEEKHDKLLDQYIMSELMNYALHKEMGIYRQLVSLRFLFVFINNFFDIANICEREKTVIPLK